MSSDSIISGAGMGLGELVGIVWLVLYPIVMKRSLSAFAMSVGSVCVLPS